MINQFANLNWMGVFTVFVVCFLLGALWFTLFFSKWYKLSLGRADQTLANKPIFVIGRVLCCLVITVASAILIYALNIQTINEVFAFIAVVGIGFLVANTVNIAINPTIPRPILYRVISGAYHLVGISLVNFILVMMK